MRAEPGPLLLWLLLTSTALQAAPAEPADELVFLEFLALMIRDEDDWIDPLAAREVLPPVKDQQPTSGSAAEATADPRDVRPPKEPAP